MTKDVNDDGTVDWLDKLDVEWDTEDTRKPPEELNPSQSCVSIVEFFEGFRKNAYQDSVGKWTVGFGFTKDVHPGDTIEYALAEDRLLEELEYFAGYVRLFVEVPLHQHEFDALTCFTFNLGPNNLESSTLLKKLNQGNYGSAGLEFLKWDKAKVDGKYIALKGLTRRRKAEYHMFMNMDWEDLYE